MLRLIVTILWNLGSRSNPHSFGFQYGLLGLKKSKQGNTTTSHLPSPNLPGEFPGHVMLQIDHSEMTTQSQFSFEKESPSNDLESLSFSNKVFYL